MECNLLQAAAQTLRGEMTFATGSKDLCSDLSETNPPVLYLRGERVKELTSDQDLVYLAGAWSLWSFWLCCVCFGLLVGLLVV